MIFSSIEYFVFFTILYSLYWILPGTLAKHILLLVGSLVFYASWSKLFLLHFLFAILVNYAFLRKFERAPSKKWLVLAIVLNLCNLGFFKYFYFFTEILEPITGFHAKTDLGFRVFLPLAISFYTFQMIAYVVDVYSGKIQEKTSLFDFAIFILFFPQLIAGPIMRHNDFFSEYRNPQFKVDYMYSGISLILLGIVKKILIADNISFIIDPVFSNPKLYSGETLALAVFGFSFQVFADFSGYTDLARGSAYLLGFSIPQNFRSPYLASSPSDLWRRWHITLSTWLRDYIYIPLGGNKGSELRVGFNQILTFTLGGLWHGANWTFILWGFFHGVMLTIDRQYRRFSLPLPKNDTVRLLIGIVISYLIFAFGALLFRSNSLEEVFYVLTHLGSRGITLEKGAVELLLNVMVAAYLIQVAEYFPSFSEALKKYRPVLLPIAAILILIICSHYSREGQEFIYFDF